jgi:hypothetical protein
MNGHGEKPHNEHISGALITMSGLLKHQTACRQCPKIKQKDPCGSRCLVLTPVSNNWHSNHHNMAKKLHQGSLNVEHNFEIWSFDDSLPSSGQQANVFELHKRDLKAVIRPQTAQRMCVIISSFKFHWMPDDCC